MWLHSSVGSTVWPVSDQSTGLTLLKPEFFQTSLPAQTLTVLQLFLQPFNVICDCHIEKTCEELIEIQTQR